MQRLSAAFLTAFALFLAACSGPAGTPSPTPPLTRIEVGLTDELRMEPGAFTVPAGVPITFVLTNTGAADHEFYVGDEAAQAEHELEMQQGGMHHDDPEGVAVSPGATEEFTYTFAEPGGTLAGCHIAGHYAGGMKAAITITP